MLVTSLPSSVSTKCCAADILCSDLRELDYLVAASLN